VALRTVHPAQLIACSGQFARSPGPRPAFASLRLRVSIQPRTVVVHVEHVGVDPIDSAAGAWQRVVVTLVISIVVLPGGGGGFPLGRCRKDPGNQTRHPERIRASSYLRSLSWRGCRPSSCDAWKAASSRFR